MEAVDVNPAAKPQHALSSPPSQGSKDTDAKGSCWYASRLARFALLSRDGALGMSNQAPPSVGAFSPPSFCRDRGHLDRFMITRHFSPGQRRRPGLLFTFQNGSDTMNFRFAMGIAAGI